MAQTYTNASLPGGSEWRKRHPSEPIPSTPLSLTPPSDDYRQRPGYQRDPAEQDPTQPDPVAAARDFLGPSALPQPGETRTANGETRTWDGQGWVLSDGANSGPYVGPGGFQVSNTDTPGQAFGHEIGRTVGEASLGLLRSPMDALKGLFHLPGQAVSGLKTLAQDPSLLGEIPEALQAVGNTTPFSAETDPKEMGSLLGQVLLGAKGGQTAALAKPYVRPAVGLAGKALTGTGKAMTAVGETTRGAGSIGAAFGLGTGNVPGAVAAMTVPPMLRGAGRLMQKGGATLEQVGSRTPATPVVDPYLPSRSGIPRSTEVPGSSWPDPRMARPNSGDIHPAIRGLDDFSVDPYKPSVSGYEPTSVGDGLHPDIAGLAPPPQTTPLVSPLEFPPSAVPRPRLRGLWEPQGGTRSPSLTAVEDLPQSWQKTGATPTSYGYGPTRQPQPPSMFEKVYGPDTAPTDAAGNPIGMGSVDMTGRTTGGNPMSDIADFEGMQDFTFEGGLNTQPAAVRIPGKGDTIVYPFETRNHRVSIDALKALAAQDPAAYAARVGNSFLKNPNGVYEMDRASRRPRAKSQQ